MYKQIFAPVLILLLITGCEKKGLSEEELAKIPFAQRQGLPEPSGGLVLVVGTEPVSSDEIATPSVIEHFRPVAQQNSLANFKIRAKGQLEQIVDGKIANILLYNQAKRDMQEQVYEAVEKAADAEVRKFIVGFGGDSAQAEEELKQMGMDWESFKEYQTKAILIQAYISSQMPEEESVSYGQLLECYNRIKDDFFTTPASIEFMLIDIEPDKLQLADPNLNKKVEAGKLARQLVERLSQNEDFAELAKKYSHGHRAMFGGLWKPVHPQALAKPYDVLADEAENTEPGRIIGPIEAGEHIFIMKLVTKQQENIKPLEMVQKEVEKKIRYERLMSTREKILSKLIQPPVMEAKEKFIDVCLEKIYWANNR